MAACSTARAPRHYVGVNLFIKNLDHSFDDGKLYALFAQYGVIISSKLAVDENGHNRGFGFVCFTNKEEASFAMSELNGRVVGTKPLYVSFFKTKEERLKQRLEKAAERSPLPPGLAGTVDYGALSRAQGSFGRGRGRSLQQPQFGSSSMDAYSPFSSPGASPRTSQATHFSLPTPGLASPRTPAQLGAITTPFSVPGPGTTQNMPDFGVREAMSRGPSPTLPNFGYQRPTNGPDFMAQGTSGMRQQDASLPGTSASRTAMVDYSDPFVGQTRSPAYRGAGYRDNAAD